MNSSAGADGVAGDCQAQVNYTIPAPSDNCAGATTVCVPPSGAIFPVGNTTVTCTATDASGNHGTCSFTVTVADNEAPQMACQDIVTNTAPGVCSQVVNYSVAPTDNCPGVMVSCTPPSGSTFAKGTTSVTCTATDASLNTATCNFTVTVEDPAFNCLSCVSLTKRANHSVVPIGGAVTYSYSVSNCAGQTLTNVTVVDDNGTPGFVGDDVLVGTIPSMPPGANVDLTHTTLLPIKVCNSSNGQQSGLLIPQILPNGNVRAIFIQSTAVNDNTYGTNAIGWPAPRGHTFKDLVLSDEAEFQFKNGAGQIVMQFKLDYISANSAYPSGYGSRGVTGGDGSVSIGNAANVVFASSSLTENLNKQPFLSNLSKYTNNSPALRDPNSPMWEYRMIYTVEVRNNAFGASGFASVSIFDQHNSPSKIASFIPVSCDSCVTNIAVATGHYGTTVVTATSEFTVSEGSPSLTIQSLANHNVLLCWPVTCANFLLEETAVLNPPASWSPVGAPVSVVGGRYCVTLPSGSAQRFYRLRAP